MASIIEMKQDLAQEIAKTAQLNEKLTTQAVELQNKIDNFDIIASSYQFGRLDAATLALTVVAVIVSIGAFLGFRFVKQYATDQAVSAAVKGAQEEATNQLRANRNLVYNIAYEAANDALHARDASPDWEEIENIFGEENGEKEG